MNKISKPSFKSLYLEMQFNDLVIANATGFLIKNKNNHYLITNRHNVTGKDNNTDELLDKEHAAIPNKIAIWHNAEGKLGSWVKRIEPLLDQDENGLWIEHPTLGKKADFVALLLTQTDNIDLHSYDLLDNEKGIGESPMPTDIINVVGFPFGESYNGKFAIWATGFIASEVSLDIDDLPIFYIDCRTRKGQSGSPVIYHRNPGGFSMASGCRANFIFFTKLLGIYSGRIKPDSDIGIVWKRSAIQELVHSL